MVHWERFWEPYVLGAEKAKSDSEVDGFINAIEATVPTAKLFLPRRLNFAKPAAAFSWKKVAKKEKNGLFALLLLLCLFDLAGDVAEGAPSIREERLSIASAVVSGALYYSLTALKKLTSVLDEEGR